MRNFGDIWWKQTLTPVNFIESIVKNVAANKNVILKLGTDFPWYDTFIEQVRILLECQNSVNGLELFLCPDESAESFLFNRFVSPGHKHQYLGNIPKAEYIATLEGCVLHGKYIYVKGVSDTCLKSWLDFIDVYRKKLLKGIEPANFILEYKGVATSVQCKKNVTDISYHNDVNDYEIYSFCTCLASEVHCEDRIKPYLAELVKSLCLFDVELCVECFKKYEDLLNNPIEVVKGIVDCSEDDIRHRVWLAQIKQVLPVLEKIRIETLEKYKNSLEDIIQTGRLRDVTGNMIERLLDCEFATLYYLFTSGQLTSLSLKDREKICLCRDVRNDIAHIKVVDFKEIKKIL